MQLKRDRHFFFREKKKSFKVSKIKISEKQKILINLLEIRRWWESFKHSKSHF